MKKWISPYYFGTAIIAGVQRFVRKMTRTSALEVVPQEDLDALHQEAVKRAEEHIRKAAVAGDPEERIWAPTDISGGKPVAQDVGDYQIGDMDRARAAAAPSAGMLKQTVPDSFAGIGGSKRDDSPLSKDPEYQRALEAGDMEALARIAHNFGKKK